MMQQVGQIAPSGLGLACMLGINIGAATTADVLTASALRRIGDLDSIKAAHGLRGAIAAVIGSGQFLLGVAFMAFSFFSLLFTLSHVDVSLVAPAVGSLTFLSNAVAAKIFLQERVDQRRWVSALLVCCGVALLKR
jgi:multidrug transporter EmrE-like cation transporter